MRKEAKEDGEDGMQPSGCGKMSEAPTLGL